MNNENYIIHFDELSKVMKKVHLWKYVAFGTVCIKQEYEIYEELAKNKFFDMGKFLKKTIERFWQAASTGYSMDEKYILAVEESMFSPRDGWEELALQFIYDLQDFFYAVADKDKNRCLEMQKRQLDFIEKYVQVAGLSNEQQKILEERAIEKHLKIALELIDIPAKDKKSFLAELSCREIDKLLGEELIGYKFDSKKEKPAKKKLPEIRATSLDFDKEKKANNNTWLMDSTPEQWVLGPECDINQRGAYAEYYREKDLLDLCYVMAVRYHLFAYDDYIQHRDAKRAQGFWYLSALTWLRAYQLRENGYPIKWVPYFERHMAGADGFQHVVGKMLCAYASGEEWLVPEIQHFSSENEKILTVPLLKLLAGESSDKIYPMVEAWDDCVWKKIVIAILSYLIKKKLIIGYRNISYDNRVKNKSYSKGLEMKITGLTEREQQAFDKYFNGEIETLKVLGMIIYISSIILLVLSLPFLGNENIIFALVIVGSIIWAFNRLIRSLIERKETEWNGHCEIKRTKILSKESFRGKGKGARTVYHYHCQGIRGAVHPIAKEDYRMAKVGDNITVVSPPNLIEGPVAGLGITFSDEEEKN